MYSSFGGELNRRQMFTKLVSCLGDDAIVLSMEGCATIIGFKEFTSKNLKLVQTDAADEESVIDVVVRTVKKEARASSQGQRYRLRTGSVHLRTHASAHEFYVAHTCF